MNTNKYIYSIRQTTYNARNHKPTVRIYAFPHYKFTKFSDIVRCIIKISDHKIYGNACRTNVSFIGYDGKRYIEEIRAWTVRQIVYAIFYADDYAPTLADNANMLVDDMLEYRCTRIGLHFVKEFLRP